jgi:hypothetical protein
LKGVNKPADPQFATANGSEKMRGRPAAPHITPAAKMAVTTHAEYHHGSEFVATNEALAHHHPITNAQRLAIVRATPTGVVLTIPFHNRLSISLAYFSL